ncbi:MAG: peroxiredoxin [Sphingomonadales bacterium]
MTIKEGDKLPDATLMRMGESGPEPVKTGDLFEGKVVLFSVPGAFTPTCSAKHLPGFVEKADLIRGKGVDKVVCMAVNDAFVMDAWGKSQNANGKVEMVGDGNGDFTRALGLTLDGRGFGLGERGQRFALVAKDGVIEKLFVEEGGAFKVSSAENVLESL